MADSTHRPAPPAYEPELLTDLQMALPLFVQIGPVQFDQVRIGTVTATCRPDGLHLGDDEIADALNKAAAVHRERARERARRHHDLLRRVHDDESQAEATADQAADTAEQSTEDNDQAAPSDPPRLEALWLPEEKVGGVTRTPFALVLSGAAFPNRTMRELFQERLDAFAQQCGARGAMISDPPLDVG